MKNILTILSLAIFLISCKNNAQENKSLNAEKTEQTDVLLDTLISLAKDNTYYSSKVDWTKLEK
jgi:PBP1b-binding outer membrane lipoprotein LpoB